MATDDSVCILTENKVGLDMSNTRAEKENVCKFTISKGEFVVKVLGKNQDKVLETNICFESVLLAESTEQLYRVYSLSDITFYSSPNDVYPLTKDQLGYLSAVKPASVRIQEYLTPNKLKETSLLAVGDVILFKLRIVSYFSAVTVRGLIHYVGPLSDNNGTFFGVEIKDEKYRGKGHTDGKPHFTCDTSNGVFIAMDKIIKKLETEEQCEGGGKGNEERSKFQCGHRVVLQTVKGDVIYGTIRWVGQVEEKGSSITTVGIETDRKIKPDKDFPELHITVTGTNGGKVFRVGLGHSRVFLPEQLVVHEDEFFEQQKRERALEREAKIAKEFDLSLEEYRSQKDYIERANSNRDSCQKDLLSVVRKKTEVVEAEEVQEDIEPVQLATGEKTGSDKQIYNGQPVSQKQIEKVLHQLKSQVEASNHEDVHAGCRHKIEKEETIDDYVNISLATDFNEQSASVNGNLFLVGSLVTVPVQRHGEPLHGVVMWVGTLPDFPGTIAGVELEESLTGCTDGTWQGMRFFHCPPGKGFFCPLNTLKQVPMELKQKIRNPLADKAPLIEDQMMIPESSELFIGDEHGIQGYQNSSYLDSTLFGLFALSQSFDDIFSVKPHLELSKRIMYYLWNGIINPLRKYGLARYESVVDLCNSIEELGQGTDKEKDPEELLNLLFIKVLQTDGFLSIKRPCGVEKDFFIQLFYEIDPKRSQIPQIKMLLTEMFNEQQISFTEVPSKLLIQVPRYRGAWNNRVIPSLTLDVKPLLDTSTTTTQDDSPSKLVLISVICIETSHYVCYTRSGNQWLFHDSMANKLYDMYNIPKVVDVSEELQEWVYSGNNLDQLMTAPARNLPQYVRRFTQDIYMCIYVTSSANSTDDQQSPTIELEEEMSLYNGSLTDSQVIVFPNNNTTLYGRLELSELKKENVVRGKSQLDEVIAPIQRLHDNNLWLSSKLNCLSNDYEKLLAALEEERKKNCELTRIKCQKDADYDHLQESHYLLEKEMEKIRYQFEVKKDELSVLQKQVIAIESSWKINHEEVTLSKLELGRGGWGVIWMGQFRGQRVAVKQMHELINQNTGYLELLHREINIMAQLRHPNLLQFIGAVLNHPSGNPMILTEIMDTSLRKAYEEKKLTSSQQPVILSIMRDVAVGLNYLHCLSDPIIHRDVSSANVLLESKGTGRWKTKISDFGSAKIARSAVTAGPGAIVYTAPECLRSLVSTLHRKQEQLPQLKQTPKMDCYSFAILLCEVLTCQFPDLDTFRNLLDEVQNASPPPLYTLVVSCIKENPQDRPTMAQIIQHIDIVL